LTTAAQIGDLLVTTRDERPVYVRDLARIGLAGDAAEARVAHLARDVDGAFRATPAVTVALAKKPGANAVAVAERALAELERARASILPEDLEVRVTRNYGETANEKADELLFHLALATVSIIALVLVSIGWREALVVMVVIPVTILLTLFAAWIMGYTLNRVSLFALIFSIGILVDDAIVVIENIARHWAMADGRTRVAAAVDAVAEVGDPTIVATLTVVAALLPMLFVSGMMGPYMSPIPVVASAAMIFSFFVAVTVTPWLMVKFGAAHGSAAHDAAHGAPAGPLARGYAALARPLLASRRRAWSFLVAVGVLTLASLGLFWTQSVTVKLLPFDDKSDLAIMLDLPRGSSVEETDRTLRRIADALAPTPEVVSMQSHAGAAAPFDFNGLVRHSYLRAEPHMGDLQVRLAAKGVRARESHEVALDLRRRIAALGLPAGIVAKVVEPPPGPPVLATLLAEIYGPDAETRRAVATKLRAIFESIPFIVDVDDSFGVRPDRLRLALVDDQLDFHRVEHRDALETIRMLQNGVVVGYSHRGEGRHPIPIRLARAKGDLTLDERALATPVPADALPGGRGVVELGDVVEMRREKASFPIFRRDGRDAEMVTAELA
ncbi:MAG TPA: efflux RND transporter permease subunit, partial [Beijerinckiaceae bacterium]